MKDIVLLGMGGHAHSVVDSIEQNGEYRIIGFLDVKEKKGMKFRNYRVIGTDSDLRRIYDEGVRNAFITIGFLGNGKIRESLYKEIKRVGYVIPNIIDKSTIIADGVKLEEGIFVGKRVVVNANAQIGKMSIINTGAIVEHDCHIGAFTHVAVGSVLCGNVMVGNSTLIGANATVLQEKKIGNNVVIGAGSIINKNVLDDIIMYGNIEKHR